MTLNSPAASRKARAPADTADPTLFEAILVRDRVVMVCALIIVIAAAWIWIALGAGTDISTAMGDTQMQMPAGMAMGAMMSAAWTPGYATLIFSMWWTMMLAMMLPSAPPTLPLFA